MTDPIHQDDSAISVMRRVLALHPIQVVADAIEEMQETNARVAELENDYQVMTDARGELLETINALNEENSQLAHRLWCIENPE